MLTDIFKSVIDTDRAAVVICAPDHTIIYMNPAADKYYEKYGGAQLLGKNLLNCHNEHSRELICNVVDWFSKDVNNNMVFTYHNEKQNKDVYLVALRNESKELIGYYEKHEYRTPETAKHYDFSASLI